MLMFLLWPLLLVYDLFYFLFLNFFGFGGSATVKKPINKICVIGTGPAGILAARYIRQYLPKCSVVIYEGLSEPGGALRYSTDLDNRTSSYNTAGYDCMFTNNSREMMSFSSFPMDQKLPVASIPGNDVVAYFEDVIVKLDLRRFIKFDSFVESVEKKLDYWLVKTSRGTEDKFDAVIVCTGRITKPKVPLIPGIESFTGSQLHSRLYRNSASFANKRVVVAGSGHSAVDICISLSKVTNNIWLSLTKFPVFVDRSSNNIPFDHLQKRLYVPFYHYKKYRKIYHETERKQKELYDQKGIRYPKLVHTALVLNDVQKVGKLLETGSVTLFGEIKKVSESTVIFEDGKVDNIDGIIYASGYARDYFPFLNVEVTPHLYQRVFYIPDPTLAFVGLVQVTSTIPNAEIQAIWVAKYLAGLVGLPNQKIMEKNKRHVDDHPRYMDKVAVAAGVFPAYHKRMKNLINFYFGITSAEALLTTMTASVLYEDLFKRLDSNGLADLRKKGFYVLSIDQLTAAANQNELFAKIHKFYYKYLAKPHSLLGREGAVCPFVPMALKIKTIHTVAICNDSFGKHEIMVVMHAIMNIMEELTSAKEETCFVVFVVSEKINTETIANLQRSMKPDFVGKGLMIGEFYEGNASPGLYNPKFHPLQSEIPALAVRTMVREDLPFMTKEEYSIKEINYFVHEYNKKFGPTQQVNFITASIMVIVALCLFLLLTPYL